MKRNPAPQDLIPCYEVLKLKEFVAADYETANRVSAVSACQLAMVRFKNGVCVDRFNSFIKPPQGYDRFEFTYLHGIAPEDVEDSPSWTDIADDVRAFVGESPVWAHNAAFDYNVWCVLDEHFGTFTAPKECYCTYRTAQLLMPGLTNYKLPTVLAACGSDFALNHHRADSDAEACGLIVLGLQKSKLCNTKLVHQTAEQKQDRAQRRLF